MYLVIGRPAFGDALTTGLNWHVWHWQCPFIWPDLADFSQGALNAVVHGEQSEIEVMLALWKTASALERANGPSYKVEWKAVEEKVCQTMPSCAAWVSALSAYVAHNAGGADGKLIRGLSSFAKAFATSGKGRTRMLGSVFLTKLALLQFGAGQEFPHNKHACVACQLQSPPHKIVDGLCQLLSSQSLSELARKDRRPAIVETERLLTESRRLCESLGMSDSDFVKVIGRFDVRIILFLTKKGREMGPKYEFKSMDEVVKAFLKEASAAVGHPVGFSGQKSGGEAADKGASDHSAAAQAPEPSSSMESVEQMQSPVFQSKKRGYTPGAFVVEKAADEASLYKIEQYIGNAIMISEQHMGRTIATKTISVNTLLESWRLHKGTVTEFLRKYDFEANQCSPLASPSWKYAGAVSAVTLALQHVYAMLNVMNADIELLVHPNIARVKSNWGPGELMLAPATSKVDRKEVGGAIPVGRFDLGDKSPQQLYIVPQFIAPVNNKGEDVKSPWVCAFYHTPGVSSDSKANLQLKCMEVVVMAHKVRVPILVNAKALQAGTELVWDKATAKSFANGRLYVTEADFNRTAKERKIA